MNKLLIPKQIDCEVTSHCNLKCKYCPTLSKDAKAQHMELKLFKSIIDRVDFKTTIVPWLNGEPLMHPNYAEMIKYITARDLPCYIITNGTIWNEELFQHITDDTSCYQIIFSLDGLWDKKSRSIEMARLGSDRKVIKENIERFMALHLKKSSKMNIALKICRRGQDYEEVENYISYWLTQGVDYVCVGSALVDDDVEGMRIYPCQYSDNNFMVIKSDGRLALCAYNDLMTNWDRKSVGKVDYDTPLLELYNNSAYTEFRRYQRKGIFRDICNRCGFPYTGIGMEGVVRFRDKKLISKDIYYHQDYYNQFFSLRKDWKNRDYYKRGYEKK